MGVFKYIVMEVNGVRLPVLFPAHISHRGMAQALTRVIHYEAREATLPVSAGFVKVSAEEVFDKSESLGMSPSESDLAEINAQYRYANSFKKF